MIFKPILNPHFLQGGGNPNRYYLEYIDNQQIYSVQDTNTPTNASYDLNMFLFWPSLVVIVD